MTGRWSSTVVAALAVGLAALIFGIWVLVEAMDDDTEGFDFGVTTADILADPEGYYGERVVLSGHIREFFGSNAFTMGAGELLVVRANELDDEADEGDVAQVVGELRPLRSEEADEEADADLDDELFEGLEARPAVFAEVVLLEPVE